MVGGRGADPLSRERAAGGKGDGQLGRRRMFPVLRPGRPRGGFDVGSPGGLAVALQELLACGQPLERILPAFTSNPARLLMLSRKGRLFAGADADLVVLDDEGGVQDVMARGRWHVRAGEPLVRGTFER